MPRSLVLWLLPVFLLFGPSAYAGDFAVAHAFDADGQKETGTVEDCDYRYQCELRVRNAQIRIMLFVLDRERRKVSISINGNSQIGCCYFSDGATRVERGADSLIGLSVYEGHARKRNEFVQNLPVGVLFLRFAEMK